MLALNLHLIHFDGYDEITLSGIPKTGNRTLADQEIQLMSTSYDVQYPNNMMEASQGQVVNWAESTIHSVVDSLEEYARAKPLSFALWTFGVGFALGWKLKPW
jgi:hypothetical protein